MYGSSLTTPTFRPRAFSRRPRDAAVMPLPSDETTPPVMNTYRVRPSTAPPSSNVPDMVPSRPADRTGRSAAAAAQRPRQLEALGRAGVGAQHPRQLVVHLAPA